MADIRTGINPTTVDTTATLPLGLEVDDPRGGTFSVGKKFRYVKAGGAISAGNVLIVDVSDTNSLEPNVLIPATAANQPIAAIAEVAIASGSFGWVQVRGRHAGALKASGATTAVTAGGVLTTSSTAGGLISVVGEGDSNVTSVKLNAALVQACGLGVQAIDSADSNSTLLEVMILG